MKSLFISFLFFLFVFLSCGGSGPNCATDDEPGGCGEKSAAIDDADM